MNYDNIFILSPEGSGSMYLWRIINKYFSCNMNSEFKLRDHQKLLFDKNKSIYHVSFPSSRRPQLWLKPEQLPKADNKIIFIQRNSIHSIYSNYRRFFSRDINDPKQAVKESIDSHKKGLQYMKDFRGKLNFPTLTITYESLMNCTDQTLNLISNYLNIPFENKWTDVIKQNPPINKNDFRFIKDKKFIQNFHI